MCKHGIILDMSCNKLIFWLGHCQHVGALETMPEITKLLQAPCIFNPTVEDMQKDQKVMRVEYLELLPYVLPEHKDVSKIAKPLKDVVSPKQILKQESISIPI